MIPAASSLRIGALVLGLGVLSACDTAEDRVNAFYNRGLELVAAGEIDKAILEFRNALQLDQDSVESRLEFAKALLVKQDFQGAIGNFLRVIELEPENVEARTNVGQILLGAGQVDQAMVHVNAAYDLAPADLTVKGLKATGEYRLGNTDNAVTLANEILATNPQDIPAAMVLVGIKVDAEEFPDALGILDKGIANNPTEISLQLTRLSILERQRDMAGVGVQLKQMVRVFPENKSIANALVRWHVTNDDIDAAEVQLRDISSRFVTDRDAAIDLFKFLRQYRTEELARNELINLTTQRADDKAFFLRVLAGYDFQQGDAEGAISRLKELLATGLTGPELNDTKMTLADIQRRTGATTEAALLFNEVLEEDPENVEGLRLRALNALDEDRPEDAIADLRSALNQAPENAQLMTILATAHERNGSPGLALERLALATRVSGYGVPEIVRYANFLTKEGQPENAATVLRDGLNRRPDTPELMAALARLELSQQNWRAAEQIAARLDAIGSEQAKRTASGIRIAAASGQQNFDQSIGLLRDMWAEGGQTTSAMENLVRTYVQTGEANKAVTFLTDILTEDTKNMRASLLLGAVRAIQGETDMAEEMYRKVIADHPTAENGYTALSALMQRLGRIEEADSVMQAGLENAPGSARLLLSQAARYELSGDFEGAIGIYENLYEQNSSAELLANNLASLLSEHRSDSESLERAFAIAKRLRSSEVPAFQDTYGWILHGRGEYERALVALRKAVEGLPNNALVNYHIGMTYTELGQVELARQYLTTAVELGTATDFPQIEIAKDVLKDIGAE